MRLPLHECGGVLLAVGCAAGELGDTPITGGSPEVREAVRAELLAFEAATGPGRARVSKVRIRPLAGVGRFDKVSHAISLSDALPVEGATWILRHELCHALDESEGPIFSESPSLYGRLAGGIFATDTWLVEGTTPPRSERQRGQEVFAAFCSLGPWVAHAVRGGCSDDVDEDASRVADHLARRVWTSFEDWGRSREADPWAFVDLDGVAEDVFVYGTATPGVLYLNVDVPGSDNPFGITYRDVRTGEVYSYLREPGLERADDAPDLPAVPEAVEVEDAIGWPGGPAAIEAEIAMYHLGVVDRRVLHGERWSLLGDGCGEVAPFALDGQVFTLRLDGDRVGWGPVE